MKTEYIQAIRELIFKVYDKCYIGKLEVKETEDGFSLSIYFDAQYLPIHINAQMEWKDFLKFVELELRARHWNSAEYFTGYKIDPPEPIPAIGIWHKSAFRYD